MQEDSFVLRSRHSARRSRSVWESLGKSPSLVEVESICALAWGVGCCTLSLPRSIAVSTRVRIVPGLSSWMVEGTVYCSVLAVRGS